MFSAAILMVMMACVAVRVVEGFRALFTGGFQFQGCVMDAQVIKNMPYLCFDCRLIGDDVHGSAVVIAVNGTDVQVMNILNTGNAQQLFTKLHRVNRCFF